MYQLFNDKMLSLVKQKNRPYSFTLLLYKVVIVSFDFLVNNK